MNNSRHQHIELVVKNIAAMKTYKAILLDDGKANAAGMVGESISYLEYYLQDLNEQEPKSIEDLRRMVQV